jgi:hypothetical protein
MKNLKSFYLFEGIGDKYAEKRFGIESDFADFDKKYNTAINSSNIIYRNTNYRIFGDTLIVLKNPKNLNNIGSWVRGIVIDNGDLYIEQEPITIHDRILKILNDLNIVKYTNYMDWVQNKNIDKENFISVQRDSNTNTIKLGESHHSKKIKAEPFLEKTRIKNPQINFINEIIDDAPDLKGMGMGMGKEYAF